MPDERPESRRYRDLIIELRDVDEVSDTFTVAVLPAGGGESNPVSVPFKMKDVRPSLGRLDRKTISFEQLITLGERLSNRLLPEGEVRELYLQSLRDAGRDGGVRLRLLLRDARLAQLPWEFAYVQRPGTERHASNFLLLNPQLSLVRHEVMAVPPTPVTPADPQRLRVVAAIADVSNAEIVGMGAVEFDELDLSAERSLVEELKTLRVNDVSVDLTRTLEGATVDSLTKALLTSADIFHFAGHGYFLTPETDPEVAEEALGGYIVLQRNATTGEGAPLSADQVATLLQRAGVRLAVLGACESARRDDGSPWMAIAPAMVRRGLPAAIAMQYDIVDEQAKEFTRMIYTALASGLSIDEAVSVGRQTLVDSDAGKGMEWGVPVLYMRAADGNLFPEIAKGDATAATQLRHQIEQVVDVVEKGGSLTGLRAERLPDGAISVTQRVKTVRGDVTGVVIEVFGGKKNR